jgi:hypothetical protein
LALAIYPAKPAKATPADKAKDKPTDQKPDPQGKQDYKAEEGKKPAADHLNPPQNGNPKSEKKQPIIVPNVPAKRQEVAPDSPDSISPKPPTPANGDVHVDDQVLPDPASKSQVKEQPKPLEAVKASVLVQAEAEDKRADTHKVPNDHLASKEDKSSELKASPQSNNEPLPEPLCLLGPPPQYLIQARLDLDPSKPWPPIEADPRGAYHLYA